MGNTSGDVTTETSPSDEEPLLPSYVTSQAGCVCVHGVLEGSSTPGLDQLLDMMGDPSRARLDVDLVGVTSIDTAAATALLHLRRRAYSDGVRVNLVNPSLAVRRVFDVLAQEEGPARDVRIGWKSAARATTSGAELVEHTQVHVDAREITTEDLTRLSDVYATALADLAEA